MDYELVTVIHPENENWKKQKKRLKESNAQVLSISPFPTFQKVLKEEGVTGVNLLDSLTQRSHDEQSFLFFNQVDTAEYAEIFMNENWSISLLLDGDEIGQVITYPNTRRHVKEVHYFNLDGTVDFIEEYADDGKLFSVLSYYKGKVQEIDFVNDQRQPILSYYFYEGTMPLVTVRNPKSFEIEEKYDDLTQFISKELAKKLTKEDTVSFTYLGKELSALRDSTSHNIFYLEEEPLDENGEVKGNLKSILLDEIQFVQTVRVSKKYAEKLQEKGLLTEKVEILD
ncbi:hypothetical protein SAMN02745116_01538 [Pilibacter termitis]|uniref:Accessory Sec system glycosyltransferase GtfB n=1 Tax=Pilibacter termitis TaxID=263852 RepID=A0A1T4NSD5_9ENTE|nr:hypothetical protein [Pilibacter termitis]SJZ82163.1 hypothetical protein SAMN02745116_01538 [Pilibacter termitis]